MSTDKHYPPLSDLINASNIPGDFQGLENSLNQGIDIVLSNVLYKDYNVQVLKSGEAKLFQLVLLTKALRIPLFSGLNLVFFKGNETSASEFEIEFEWHWPLGKYLRNFEQQGFSYAPEAFIDILIDLTELNSREEFFHKLVITFLDDGNDSFLTFFDDLNTSINSYDTGASAVTSEIQNITTRITTIKNEVNTLVNITNLLTVASIFERYKNNNTIVVAIDSILTSLEVLEEDHDITIDLERQITGILLNLISDPQEKFNRLLTLFQSWLVDVTKDDIKDFLIPQFAIILKGISMSLEFPRNILKPLIESSPGVWEVDDTLVSGELIQASLNFTSGPLRFDSKTGFDIAIDEGLSIDLPRCRIGNTELDLEFLQVKLDLSRKKNIPEAIADGRPDDFIGAYITEGNIYFPTFWNHDDGASTGQLKVRNLLVGTGGISGTIGLEAKTAGNPSPLISANFGGGFQVSLNAFSLTFQQNSIIESTIQGTMKIPGFKDTLGNDAEVNIDVWIGTNGEFSVTASEDQGITALRIPNILDVNIDSLTIGRKQDRFFVAISGAVDFAPQSGTIGQFLPDKIDIQKLIIWQDGQVEFEGGTLVLPKAITLKIKPVELSITAIGFGSHQQEHNGIQRKYKFFEFSGGVSINPGGVDARGDGIKVYFSVDDDEVGQSKHVFVRIQGIGIDIIIPGSAKPADAAVLLSGYLSMKDPAPGNEAAGTEYAGGITFTLPKVKMGGSAAMRLNPKVPAFLVDIGLEIATPIPLGSTGLGIYGFRALLGQRYVATKGAAGVAQDGEWWQYYKAKIAPDYSEGIQASKFDQTNGFSLGAGVSFATATDSGKTFSSKLFFLLSLPEVFMLQGQGQILKERIGLDTTTDPPFFALIAISKQSVEAAFGVNLMIPDDKRPGSIAKVDALIEMGFFFGNSSSWYVNIGRDLPESRRVTVRLLELFDAYFYFMISSAGIRAGAGAKFEFNKKFGPLRAELGAYLDVAGKIQFKPKQFGASIQMGGYVGLYIFKFGFKITVDAGLAGEAPKPFIVTGKLKACVMVLKKDRCAKFEFTWNKDSSLDTSEVSIMDRPVAAKAINMMTRESFDVYSTSNAIASLNPSSIDNFSVPMDSFIDLEFVKGVLPSTAVKNEFGGNTQGAKYVDYVSPQKSKSSRVRHEYHLNNLKIYTWNNSAWVPYDIYDAATPLASAPFITSDLTALKSGYWQYQHPGLHNKLRVMAQSPLSFLSMGSAQPGDIIMEDLGITDGSIYCPPEAISKTCIDFTDLGKGSKPGDIILNIPADQIIFYQHFLFKINGNDANIVFNPYSTFINALALRDNDELEIVFTEPMSCISFNLQTVAPNVKIHYYKKVELPDLAPTSLPQFEFVLVETKTLQPSQLSVPVVYDDIDNAIEKVVVQACQCETPEPDMPFVCNADISQQAKDLQNFLDNLARNKHLTANINLYPNHHGLYNGVFQNTSLYQSALMRESVVQSSVQTNTENQLVLSLKDNFGFECFISLSPQNPPMNWNAIIGFSNLQPYNTMLGQNYEFQIDAELNDGSIVTLTGRSCYPIIECYDDCTTFIYQLCFLAFDDAQSNATLPDSSEVQSEIDALTEGFNESIQPVWRPNAYYAIEADVVDKLFLDSSTSTVASYPKKHIFAFKTKGPVGHFHQGNPVYNALKNVDREAEFKVATLQHYIDYDKSYPNPDGALIKAKPLFFIEPELLLFYVKNYVYEFYRTWDEYQNNEEVQIDLESIILDPAPDTTLPPAAPIPVGWVANALPGFILDVVTLNNMAENGQPCVDTEPITPMGVNSVVSIDQLEPLKLYTAIFNAKYKLASETEFSEEEVHRYVFQTSRYGNFEEQVNSYILETDPTDVSIITKAAIFDVNLNVNASALSTAIEIIDGTLSVDSPLRQEFADAYDRLMDGVLKTGAIHPAVTTEFNVIKDTTSGNILGILVRNPEPFNDPKIPTDIIELTIQASTGATVLSQKIFSKDYRNIFLSNDSLNIPLGEYDFTFEYRQWNGSEYAVKTSIALSINLS